MINKYFCNKKTKIWSLRLSVRTRGFHPRKRGSIPLGTAKNMFFYVYMLIDLSKKPFYTYVGYTGNLKKRLQLHNSSLGAKFTRGRKWKLIYKEKFRSKSKAISREYYIKRNRTLRNKLKNENLNTTTL